MPTTVGYNQGQTDICNLALMRLGQRRIQSITDQNGPDSGNAIACNVAWVQALAEVSRDAPWNCLKKRAYLGQLAPGQNPNPQYPNPIPPNATTWAPGQNYAVNAYVIYASYLYQCLIANTSSGSFTVDLTRGYWFQTNYFWPNYLGPSVGNAGPLFEFNYAYQLPPDFLALIELNGTNCFGGGAGGYGGWGGRGSGNGSLYEIYEKAIYCNTGQADIKYVRFEQDTTKYDSLFTGALVINLACMMATTLRKDDSALALRLRQEYMDYLVKARLRNAGESNPRRYNIVSASRFVGSRFRSTNG
jgi:hypothetical protein